MKLDWFYNKIIKAMINRVLFETYCIIEKKINLFVDNLQLIVVETDKDRLVSDIEIWKDSALEDIKGVMTI